MQGKDAERGGKEAVKVPWSKAASYLKEGWLLQDLKETAEGIVATLVKP